jgi:hypothetical protein
MNRGGDDSTVSSQSCASLISRAERRSRCMNRSYEADRNPSAMVTGDAVMPAVTLPLSL